MHYEINDDQTRPGFGATVFAFSFRRNILPVEGSGFSDGHRGAVASTCFFQVAYFLTSVYRESEKNFKRNIPTFNIYLKI